MLTGSVDSLKHSKTRDPARVSYITPRFALVLLSFCSRFALVLLSFCSRFALVLLSFCSRFALILLAFCSHFALVLLSFGSRFARDLLTILLMILLVLSQKTRPDANQDGGRGDPEAYRRVHFSPPRRVF